MLHSTCSMFADDVKLCCKCCKFSSAPEWSDAYFPIVRRADSLAQHREMNDPARQQQQPSGTVHWGGNVVGTSRSHQDLGVVITDDLRWTDHIQKISGRASTMIYLLMWDHSYSLPNLLGWEEPNGEFTVEDDPPTIWRLASILWR